MAIEEEMSDQIASVVIREIHLFLHYYISAILSMYIAGFLLMHSFNSASFMAVEKMSCTCKIQSYYRLRSFFNIVKAMS